MISKALLLTSAFFALIAVAIWAVLLRPVPTRTASGTIKQKTFKPAGTYWQYPAGSDRGFRTATPIPIAEAYVFEIATDAFDGPVFYSLNTIASRDFSQGQKVNISYRERGIPFLWKRLYVGDMTAGN